MNKNLKKDFAVKICRSTINPLSINQSINPLFKHVTPRSTEVLVKTCTCMYN